MDRRLKICVAGVLIVMACALGALLGYLLQQGLLRASLWATFLVLPLTVVTAVAGVWAAVLAARALRDGREQNERRSAEDVVDSAVVARSGNVHQERTCGPAIAHTGAGDIIVPPIRSRGSS